MTEVMKNKINKKLYNRKKLLWGEIPGVFFRGDLHILIENNLSFIVLLYGIHNTKRYLK